MISLEKEVQRLEELSIDGRPFEDPLNIVRASLSVFGRVKDEDIDKAKDDDDDKIERYDLCRRQLNLAMSAYAGDENNRTYHLIIMATGGIISPRTGRNILIKGGGNLATFLNQLDELADGYFSNQIDDARAEGEASVAKVKAEAAVAKAKAKAEAAVAKEKIKTAEAEIKAAKAEAEAAKAVAEKIDARLALAEAKIRELQAALEAGKVPAAPAGAKGFPPSGDI